MCISAALALVSNYLHPYLLGSASAVWGVVLCCVGEVSRRDLHCTFLVNHRTNLYGTAVQYRLVMYSCTVPVMYRCTVQTGNIQLYSTGLYYTAVQRDRQYTAVQYWSVRYSCTVRPAM